MSESKRWYVVRSKARREGYAQEQLLRRGVETFLPRILELAPLRDASVVAPLFPGYLFARIDLAAQHHSVIWSPGVRGFVAFGEVPAPVDAAVIEFLQVRCGREGVVRVERRFNDGDRVRVTHGPLSGLIGVVEGHVHGDARVRVLMALLRRPTQVSVPARLLEPVAHA
jgi:transcriptional antiterminator RfaH